MAKDIYAEKREAFDSEAVKSINTENDLNEFRQIFTKMTIETALSADIDGHLGYNQHP